METKLEIDSDPIECYDSSTNEGGNGLESNAECEDEDFSSQELREIISHKPSWIVRRGVALIGLVLVFLLVIASFISYPDQIATTMRIVSRNETIKVAAPFEGKMKKVLVANGSLVRRNQVLGLMEDNELQAEVSGKNRNIIFSPADGILQYEMPLHENQYISLGENLFYIEPVGNNFYGELIVNQKEWVKIKRKQTVIIKLDAYPSSEYGSLSGIVSFISPDVNSDNNYVVYVTLPEDGRSSYNKKLSYKNNLTSRVQVITGDHKLLEKLIAFGNPLTPQK